MKKFALFLSLVFVTSVTLAQSFSYIEDFDTYGTGDLGTLSADWAPENTNPQIPIVNEGLSPGTTHSLDFNGFTTVFDYLPLINNPEDLTANVPFYFGVYFKMETIGAGTSNRIRVAVRVDDDNGQQWIREIVGRYDGVVKARLGLGGPNSNHGQADIYEGQLLQFVVKGVWDGVDTITYSYTLSPTLVETDNTWIPASTSHTTSGTPSLGRIFISNTSINNIGKLGPVRLSTTYAEVVDEVLDSEPSAAFSAVTNNLQVDLDASASVDDVSIASYGWTMGDGQSSSGETLSYTYAAAGTYTVELTVTDTNGGTDQTSQDITVDEPFVATFPYQINFQDEATTPPAGYVKDFGEPYGAKTGGLTYGWITLADGTPIDLTTPSTGVGRNRNNANVSDLRLNTLVHMQGNDVGSWTGNRSNEGVWEIDVPNGWYEVTVSVGDPNQDGQVSETPDHFIRVEGVTAIEVYDVDSSLPNGDPGRFTSGNAIVQVTDGKITIDADDPLANNTKINYAIIAETTPLSSETDILTFSLPEQTGDATIDALAHTISIEVSAATDLSALAPTLTASAGASVVPDSGDTVDFSNSPVDFLVTAEDGITAQTWAVTVTEETIVVPVYEAHINFQNSAVTPPAPYLIDYGKEFGNANNEIIIGTDSYTYGWKLASNGTPIDASNEAANNGDGVGRNRLGNGYAAASDQEKLEGTLVHFQGDNIRSNTGAASWAGQPRGNELIWELEIPNGTYAVTISLGDQGTGIDSRHSITAEGYTVVAAFVPTPTENRSGTIVVSVQDGLLTLTGLGGYNSKINYIDVVESTDTAVNGVLAFSPNPESISLEAGATGTLSSTLSGAGATDIGLAIEDNINTTDKNLTGTNDWLTLPNQNTLGQFDFSASATGLTSGDTRSNTIVATAQGFQPASLTADLTVTEAQIVEVTIPFRLNVAGAEYNRDGDIYSADDASYLVETQPTTVSTTSYTPYTVPGGHQNLYFPRRFGPEFSYVFPVANGTYNVAIHMVENFQTAANARIFDVSIEGEVKIDDIDLFATYGKGALGIQTFEVTVADGTLDIDFLSSVNNAIVQAIEILPISLSNETDIITFAFAEQTGEASIDDQAHTVAIEVTNGTDLSGLVPTITLSDGATVSPLSGVANDFTTSPVEYLVTAEDGVASQAWNVTVSVAPPANTAPVISSAAAVDVAENSLAVVNVEASDDSDAEGSGLVFGFNGGVDDALFTIDGVTGEISFISAPDFEIPQDDGGNNIYDIKVIVTDSGTLSATQDIAVTVTDVDESVPCTPLSTLNCEDVVVTLPVNLDFSGAVAGTMQDTNGLGTGFTAVLEHSEARRAGDLAISNPDVNGYEPLLLTIGGGTLDIVSQAGISYLDPPASSNNNNQVNSLGVGLTGVTNTLTIETTLLGITTGGSAAQAGLWFGIDEDNFVKLNVNNDNVELRKEVGGLSVNGAETPDQIQVNGVGVSGQDVTLRLVIDPVAETITAFYSIGEGAFVQVVKTGLSEMALPAAYLNGRDLNPTTQDVAFAGIYATHRNGTQFTASFDAFSVEEAATPLALSFEQNTLDFTAEQNEIVAAQTIQLLASVGNPEVVFQDDPDASEWLLLPTTNTIGSVEFGVKTDIPSGFYTTTVFAIDQPDLGYENASITINLTVTEPNNDFSAKVNFSTAGAPTPVDYVKDAGETFGDRGNGLNYGWFETDGITPLNVAANARARGVGGVDERVNTLIHMQYGDTGGTNGVATEGIWEIEVPNDTYLVLIGAGDPTLDGPGTEPIHRINAEGVNIINDFEPTGAVGAATRYTTGSALVTVADGRLTIDASGGFNTKINYVEISVADNVPQAPRVVGVIPNDNATGVSVNTSVSANNLFLPNFDTNGIAGVNNSTITSTTVRLLKQGSVTPIGATVNGTGGGDAINLVPNLPLEANTTYVFEVNGVEDTAGETFEFFTSTFTTGSGNTGGNTDLDNVSFSNEGAVGSPGNYATLTIGPDGKLYGLQISGDIHRWTMNADGSLADEEVLTGWKSSYGARAAIGLAFDPTATPTNLIAYISHQSGVLSNAPDWDGKISRISGANLENEQLLVTDLPRSLRDHLTNSITFRAGENGVLYFNQGSNSAAGAPDNAWGNREESLLSAATLKLDLSLLPNTLPLNARTTRDIDAIKAVDVNSPTLDGLYNPYYVNAPLTLVATGVRNAYDLLWHSNGQLYIPTNGTAGGSNAPASIDDMYRPDGTIYDHDDVSGNYPVIPASNNNNTQRDWLFRVDPNTGIGYYGHPNPFRGEFVLNRGDADVNNAAYNGVQADINYRGAAFDFEFNKSPNGVIEYRSNAENGNLQGAILVVRYSGGSDIIALVPDGPNGDIATSKIGIPGFTGFQDPLDLVEDVTTGNIYVSDYGRREIVLLKPNNQSSPAPVIALSEDTFIGDAIASGSDTATQEITLSNLGNALLENITADITGADAAQFSVQSLPTSVASQNSGSFTIVFDPASVGPKFAQLTISGDNADPVVMDLQGLGKTGVGGANEPSLQWILDTHLGLSAIDVGDTDDSTNLINLPNGSSYNDLIGDEIDAQLFERAVDAPVTLEVLGVYGPEANNPIVAFGWYPSGDAGSATELFTVENSTAGNGQTLNPIITGQLEFDPGVQSFGFFNRWPFFSNRILYSEDALNTFNGAIPHHVRVYPLPGEQNAYVIATEEHISGFDYQDIVVIARNVQPVDDSIVGCSPISTLECDELAVSVPFNLTFDGAEGGLSNTGFTMVDAPSARIPEDGPISNPDVPGYEPSQITVASGNLTLVANKGIAFVTNTASTEVNSQINTLGVGITAGTLGNFSITTTIVEPYTDGDNNSEQAGVWFGLDEDNFVKLVANAAGAVELRSEVGGASGPDDQVVSPVAGLNTSTVTLRLFVDTDNDLLTAFYQLEGASEQELGSLPLPASYITGNASYSNLSFAGIFASKRREDAGTEVTYTFEDFAISSDNLVTFQPVKINYSLPNDVPPTGYEVDSGLGYGLRTNGLTYGWLTTDGQTPLDVSTNARNRAVAGIDILRNTLIHMQYNDVGGNNGVNTEAIWEIEVPNGTYDVVVNVGDPTVDGQAGTSPEHSINVEGVNIIDKYAPVGPQGDDGRFTSGSTSVTVNDGRLTIDAFGGFNTKITSLEISQSSSSGQPFFTNVTPPNNATNVALEDFQINVELVVPNGYELDEGTLAGNVNLFEVTGGGEVLVPSNSNDTGGGDAITLTPLGDLKELTTYIFRLSSDIEANLIGDVNDRLAFQAFESTFTTGEFDDSVIPIRDLSGVEFTKVFGEGTLGAGTENQRFSSLAIGPDGKLYASTIGDFQSDGKIYRWDMASDGTLSNLEILSPELQGSPHPVTNATDNNNRLIIGFAFDPAATADNLIAYVTHSKASVTNGPEWDGKLTRLSGPNLTTVQDLVIHLPRSTKDHLTNSIAFDNNGDMYINQGSNSAGGEPDAAWGFRPERLLAAAVLKLELDKLPGTLPLSAYTTDDISVINSAPANSLTMSNGTYNPYATNAPLTIFATGVRNAYDLVWHSNGWLYVPTNGTAGNNSTSPNSPSTEDYTLARRIDGLTSIPDAPALNGGETQKDWLFKTMGGSYHGHPNPYRGEFVLNHGGISYSGLPGQAEASYVDVAKYPDDLGPDPNYLEPAYDFGKNKSPNGVIEYKSDAFDGKLQGLLFVVRFSGQDDILGMDPKPTGNIQEAYNSIPGLSGFDDPLDVVEDPLTGNMYVSEYDRDNNGTARLTLLRAAIPATTGPKIASVEDELIFEITVNNDGENTDTKTIEITNEGNETLNISDVSVTGAFGNQFNTVTPSAPQTIAPNASVVFSVTYAPDLDGSDLGYQQAVLTFTSDDENTPSFEIGLHALKKAGFEGGEEPPLQDVVDALGIGIDVGWTSLSNGTDAGLIGDEVDVERWIKSSSEPVTLVPVGRYSPGELLPFGWYTNDGSIILNEVGALADGLANAQTLFPPLETGTTSFDPEGAVFGIYVDSNTFNRTNYTEDAINTGGVAHRTRVYPNRDREGNDIPNSYLIAFEDATNGDYQDYIFVLSNAEPFEDGTLALTFAPEQLDFTAAINQETVPTQATTLSANGGLTGSSVSLEASEPWVVLPPDGLGSLDIGVDTDGLSVGSYSATVTASAPNYVSSILTINLEITNEIVYTYQFNFQDVDDVETSPTGYIDDVGTPYSVQSTSLGNLTFGWVQPGTETPADATENGRNRNTGTNDDAVLKTFTIIGHRTTGTFPTLDWLVDVPNGQYYVNISVGDPDFSDSNHVLDVNGVTVVDYDQQNDPNNVVNFENTEFVEVTDGKLRLSLGNTGVNAKPNYIRLAPFNIEQVPPAVTITLDGNSSSEGVYRGLVTATVQAESQNSSALESVEYQINDGPILTYVDPIEISDEGDYVLKVIAADGNGNVTEETEAFSIQAPSGAILQVENLTKIPETTDGIPAEDYFTFHNVGATRANAIVNFSNTMRVNNTGTGNLIIDEIQLPSTANFEFVLRDFDGNIVAALPATVEPNEFLDVEIDFIRQTGGKGLYIEELTLVTNADNGLDGKVTLNGAYMSAFEGNNELTAQEVVEAFGFQTSTLSIVNDDGTITPQNTNPARPSSNYPLAENVNAGYEGDLVLSPTFVQADPSQSVRGIQLAALHGFATNGAEFVQATNNTRVGGILFNHNSNYYQTLLPKNNDGDINYDDAANITIPFRIKVAGFLTSGQGDDGNGNPALLGVRVFKVVDRDGNVVPNEYIVVQDFIGSTGCGAGSANCDWNDNVFLFKNIRPEAVPSASAIDDILIAVGQAFSEELAGSFDIGYPGNKLTYTGTVEGNALPAWLILNPVTGALSGTPPQGSPGELTVDILATDLNGLTTSSSVKLVIDGPPVANDDIIVVEQNSINVLDTLLDNDTEPNGQEINLVTADTPLNGDIDIDLENNTITYTPTENYVGPDSFEYTIEDESGLTDTALVSITVTEENQPPVAVIGASTLSGQAALFVDFNATSSTDDNNDIVAYLWDFGDGSPNTTDAVTSHTFNTPGTFVVTLTVTDGLGLTGQTTVNVQVSSPPNAGPTAFATSNVTSGGVPLTVDFDGTGSSDDTGIVTYVWDFGDGSDPANGAVVQHEYTATGSYTATLTVTDGEGETDSDTIAITVLPDDPGCGALPSPWSNGDIGAVGATGEACFGSGTFEVSGSGADIWGSTDEFHYVYQELTGDGEIIARVVSQDNTDGWAKAGVMFREDLSGDAAMAYMAMHPNPNGLGISYSYQHRAVKGQSMNVPANIIGPDAASYPYYMRLVRNGDDFMAYASETNGNWTFIGTRTIDMGQTVYVGLAVTSHNDGVLSQAVFDNVSVESDGVVVNQPPVAAANSNVTSGTVPLTVDFDGTGSTDDVGIVTYSWDFGDGSGTATGATVQHEYTATGSYTATLTVTDGEGLTDTDTIAITVLPDDPGCGPLPSPWSNGDIGSVGATGEACFGSGTFEVSGSGSDIWGASDEFHYVYQELTGDGEIIARVVSQEDTDDWAKAGVMFREDLSGDAAMAYMAMHPNPRNGGISYSFQNRSAKGVVMDTPFSIDGPVGASYPYYMRLVRSGSTFMAYASATNGNWTLVGTQSISMGQTVYVGLAVTSHNDGVLSQAVFDNVSVDSDGVVTNQPPVAVANSNVTSGTVPLTVDFDGTGSSDDTGIVTYAWDFGDGSDPANGAVVQHEYTATGSYTATLTVTDGEGETDSDTIAITVLPDDPGCGALPSPWSNGDIGAVGATGEACFGSGTFEVSGSGADIWGSTDEFHYVYQELTGDGEIIARVVSQDNTDGWAKAGVMFREDLSGDAAMAYMAMHPNPNGLGISYSYQHRAVKGQSMNVPANIIGPDAASYPYYMRLVRNGDDFMAYASETNGNWTFIGTRTIDMGQTVYVGLAVTSHNDGVLSQAVFDNVSVESDGVVVNQPPVAAANSNVTSGTVPLTVDFDGTGSTDDVGIVTYSWDFGDGSGTATGATVQHEYTATGSYTATLTVTDGEGLTDTDTIAITVLPDDPGCGPLPSPWSNGDIGSVGATGEACFGSGTFEVSGSGSDIWGASDEFHYVYQELTGDGEIIARVVSQEDTDDWAKAGVMFREDLSGDAAMAYMAMHPNPRNGGISYSFQNRSAKGVVMDTPFSIDGPVGASYPYYMRLVRSGSTFMAYASATNGNWTLVGTQSISMGQTVYVGLAVTSHNDGVLSQAVFDNVSVDSDGVVTNQPPVAVANSNVTSGTVPLTVDFDGTGSSDDTGIVTYVWDFGDGSGTATGATVQHEYTATGSYTATLTVTDGEGETDSDTIAITVLPDDPGCGALPSPWSNGDIGAVGATGDACFGSGTFQIQGSGYDIWEDIDEFHYVYQELTGDGEIIARLVSQEDTNDWAKAGVMFREDLSDNSAMAYMSMHPNPRNGGISYSFQHRGVKGEVMGTPGSIDGPVGASYPYYLRLVRSGNDFMAYASLTNGNWTLVGTETIGMNQTVYVGLAVTSHNDGVLGEAVFDNVSVSGGANVAAAVPLVAEMDIFPNPTVNTVNLRFENEEEIQTILFFDMIGRMVKRVEVPANQDVYSIDVYELPSGTYIIKSEDSVGNQFEQKMVIRR